MLKELFIVADLSEKNTSQCGQGHLEHKALLGEHTHARKNKSCQIDIGRALLIARKAFA
jgi:hypothetical protein